MFDEKDSENMTDEELAEALEEDLRQLVDMGYVETMEIDGETHYRLTEEGSRVANVLFETSVEPTNLNDLNMLTMSVDSFKKKLDN